MLNLGCRATLHRACESSYWEYILLRIWYFQHHQLH